MSRQVADLPRAWPVTGCRAEFRREVTDFRVDEVLGLTLDGEGEHVFLYLEKIGLNTEEVARRVARLADVRPMDVGFCGMKDRRAVARQWFSVYLANRPVPAWNQLNEADLQVLEVNRHRQKLRRGQHLGNAFEIRLRDLQGDREALVTVLTALREQGFPNFFGEQRFGINGANLDRAENLFRRDLRQRDRHKRGIYLSAARSWLFNQVLARRVAAGTWQTLIDGDLAGEVPVADWRVQRAVPTGPLYGDAPVTTEGSCGQIERAVAESEPLFIEGLKSQRIRPERRPLVAYPMGLRWTFDGQDLTLNFALTSGSFATAMLRECVDLVVDWYRTENRVSLAAMPVGPQSVDAQPVDEGDGEDL